MRTRSTSVASILTITLTLASMVVAMPPAGAEAVSRHTVVVFDPPVALAQVEGLWANGGRPVTLHHVGAVGGGLQLIGSGPLQPQLDRYADHLEAYVGVSGVRLDSVLPALPPAVASVSDALVVDATQTVAIVDDAHGPRHAVIVPQHADADTDGSAEVEAATTGSQPWTPSWGLLAGDDELHPASARRVMHTVQFSDEALAAFPEDRGYEHDLKLTDSEYDGRLVHPFCTFDPGEFWADRSELGAGHDFPESAGFYVEDEFIGTALDGCGVLDLSFGVLYPERLESEVTYEVGMVVAAGVHAEQDYELAAQGVLDNCPDIAVPFGGPVFVDLPRYQNCMQLSGSPEFEQLVVPGSRTVPDCTGDGPAFDDLLASDHHVTGADEFCQQSQCPPGQYWGELWWGGMGCLYEEQPCPDGTYWDPMYGDCIGFT